MPVGSIFLTEYYLCVNTEKLLHILFHGANSCNAEVLDQDLCNIRAEKCRKCRAKVDIPVSYTHLRAHETGRNLVCRLLLEKKKQTTISYAVFCLKTKTDCCLKKKTWRIHKHAQNLH